MKKLYLSVMAVVVIGVTAFSQTHYNGNNNVGFGGVVGPGSLDVSNDGTNLTFQFNRGTGNMNDVLVIYIDANAGGYSSTANFTDDADGLRKAVSGYTSTNNNGGVGRATFNFFTSSTADSSFTPEYAVAFQPGNGSDGSAGLYALQENASLTLLSTPVFTNSNTVSASTYTVIVPLAQLSFSGSSVSFKLIGTYISNTAYRSDEAVGDPMTGFSQGWNSYTATKRVLYYEDNALPVQFGNITGSLQNKSVTLNWSSLTETNTKSYLVQKSADGSSFTTLATLPSQNKSTGAAYTYVDNGQLNDRNYYRIIAVDIDGRQTISRVIGVANATGAATVKAYFTGHALNIKMTNAAVAKYEFVLYSSNGQKVAATVYQHPGGQSSTVLAAASGLPGGIYYLSIQSGTERQSIRVFNQ